MPAASGRGRPACGPSARPDAGERRSLRRRRAPRGRHGRAARRPLTARESPPTRDPGGIGTDPRVGIGNGAVEDQRHEPVFLGGVLATADGDRDEGVHEVDGTSVGFGLGNRSGVLAGGVEVVAHRPRSAVVGEQLVPVRLGLSLFDRADLIGPGLELVVARGGARNTAGTSAASGVDRCDAGVGLVIRARYRGPPTSGGTAGRGRNRARSAHPRESAGRRHDDPNGSSCRHPARGEVTPTPYAASPTRTAAPSSAASGCAPSTCASRRRPNRMQAAAITTDTAAIT